MSGISRIQRLLCPFIMPACRTLCAFRNDRPPITFTFGAMTAGHFSEFSAEAPCGGMA
jgi:hypothetical protein